MTFVLCLIVCELWFIIQEFSMKYDKYMKKNKYDLDFDCN